MFIMINIEHIIEITTFSVIYLKSVKITKQIKNKCNTNVILKENIEIEKTKIKSN